MPDQHPWDDESTDVEADEPDEVAESADPGDPADDPAVHDTTEDDFSARVDDLFADAVERQVAEQRTLNRLLQDIEHDLSLVRDRVDELQVQLARDLGPIVDRLGGLDATLRGLRDTTGQQATDARAQLDAMNETVRTETREQATELAGDIAGVRRRTEELAEQLAGVSAALDAGLERLDARQDHVASELARVGAGTGAGSGAAGTELGPVADRIESMVGQLRDLVLPVARGGAAAGRAGDRLAARVNERLDAVDERLRAQQATLDARLDALEAEVASSRTALRAQFDEFRALLGGVAARLQDGPDAPGDDSR